MKLCGKTACCRAKTAFTLVEVLMAFLLMVMVLTGVFYAYSQANRMAEYSSMALAAQSYSSQGLEQFRSTQWDSEAQAYTNQFPNIPPTNSPTAPVWTTNDYLDVPQSGNLLTVTNQVYEFTNESSPPLLELRSVVVWTFPMTHKLYTNITVTLRAPDE